MKRACFKYDERISGLEEGVSWAEVKEKQKARLSSEQEALSGV